MHTARADLETWVPIGIAVQHVIEGVVVRNPHFAKIWIKHDLTASSALICLGIPIEGERQ